MTAEFHIRIVNAEALRILPGEVLLIHIKDDLDQDIVDAANKALADVGLADRSLVIIGENISLGVVEP